MKNKMNSRISTRQYCNGISNLLDPTKRVNTKIVITNQYYRDVCTPVVEKRRLETSKYHWTALAFQLI